MLLRKNKPVQLPKKGSYVILKLVEDLVKVWPVRDLVIWHQQGKVKARILQEPVRLVCTRRQLFCVPTVAQKRQTGLKMNFDF